MRIGELSRTTGVSRDTLRFYEKRGLIRSARRTNGYRDYSEDAAFVVNHIRVAQALGFTLAEFAAELPAIYAEGVSQQRINTILTAKIAVIDARMEGLAALRRSLAERREQACPLVLSHQKNAVG